MVVVVVGVQPAVLVVFVYGVVVRLEIGWTGWGTEKGKFLWRVGLTNHESRDDGIDRRCYGS